MRISAASSFNGTFRMPGDKSITHRAYIFGALARGITVRVGRSCRTNARYRLSSVHQVHQFLEKLEGEFA